MNSASDPKCKSADAVRTFSKLCSNTVNLCTTYTRRWAGMCRCVRPFVFCLVINCSGIANPSLFLCLCVLLTSFDFIVSFVEPY
jgi:hypothetical protein